MPQNATDIVRLLRLHRPTAAQFVIRLSRAAYLRSHLGGPALDALLAVNECENSQCPLLSRLILVTLPEKN